MNLDLEFENRCRHGVDPVGCVPCRRAYERAESRLKVHYEYFDTGAPACVEDPWLSPTRRKLTDEWCDVTCKRCLRRGKAPREAGRLGEAT